MAKSTICGSHGIFRGVTETTVRGRNLTDVTFQKNGAHLTETREGLDLVQFGHHTHLPDTRIAQCPLEEDPRSLKLTTGFVGGPSSLSRRVEQTISQDGHTRLEEVVTDSRTTSNCLTVDVDPQGGVVVHERNAMFPHWSGHRYQGSISADGQSVLLRGRDDGRELGFLLAPSSYSKGIQAPPSDLPSTWTTFVRTPRVVR